MSEWQFKKLSDLCNRIGDGLHGTPVYDDKSNIYFINGNNLKKGKIEILDNTNRVCINEYNNNYIELNGNTLLVSINGTLGNLAFYNNEKIILGKSAAYLNFKSPINKFYYYYFQLKEVQEYFYNNATGSTIKNLSLKSLQDFEVPVLDETEWKKIASVLSSLDAKIELNNRIISELEAMAKQLYDYWFVQFDFPNAEGKPYRSSGGKMVYNETLKREIPEGWEVKKLEQVATIIGGSTPSTEEPKFFSKDGFSWITPKDLSENKGLKYLGKGQIGVTEAGMRSASLKILPKGTILMSSRAPIGYLAIASQDTTSNQGLKSFVADKSYPSDFLFYTIQHIMPIIESKGSGSTFKEVSGADVKCVEWYFPTSILANKFEKSTFELSKKQLNCQNENQELIFLRDWLLPMLMNGQVKVR